MTTVAELRKRYMDGAREGGHRLSVCRGDGVGPGHGPAGAGPGGGTSQGSGRQ